MTRSSKRALALLALPYVVAATACGSDSSRESVDTTAPATPTTAAAAPATAPPATAANPSGAVASYVDIQPAVVQIVAQGTFRDPAIGFADGSGLGSGFVISPDGLAITNNHVVAGAATLEVYIGGELDESYNATVLGVSECNDLALIAINAPEDLPYLEWHEGPITAGLDVYAAGYPLGDPEFTLTRGIVAKAEAGGDITGTSSIDHTVEHDANIQPGNSGGPLVGADGKVVAVNYAGGASATTTAQFYAIASDLAQPVIEQLRDGDFESLGINGWAVYDEGLGISGVWVAGVDPGSPAAEAELLPGDIVTAMNGLPVGSDGTFKDYCDVIRTAGEGAPINIEVLRFDTSEVLRGEINGDQPIELAFSIADAVEDEVGDDPGVMPEVTYESVTDDTGAIHMDVPTTWTARSTAPITLEDGTPAPYIAASTDLDGFINGWTAPGILFAKLPATTDVNASLAQFGFAGECTDGGIVDYSDAVFTGKYQVWQDCAGTTTDVVTLVALPGDGSYTALIQAQILTDADLDALQQAFDTFNSTS